MPVQLYFFTWIPNLILQTAFFAGLSSFASGAASTSHVLVGVVIRLAALPTCLQTTYHLVADREEGNLSYITTTPARFGLLWLGRSLYFAVEGILTVLLLSVLVLPRAMLAHSLLHFLGYVLIVSVICLSLAGLGLFVGSLVYRTTYDMVVTMLATQALLLVSGVLAPAENLPSWIARLSLYTPLTHGLRAARMVIQGVVKGWVPELVAEGGIGAIYWSVGLVSLVTSIRAGRKKGSLEAF
jgi:ABC-2 type transport system permease protein